MSMRCFFWVTIYPKKRLIKIKIVKREKEKQGKFLESSNKIWMSLKEANSWGKKK